MRGVVTSPFDLVLGYDPSAENSRLFKPQIALSG
jgi:hypothetical protein